MAELDFSKIKRRSAADSATEPRRIFAALPGKEAKYGYPRDVQSEVWQAWHKRRSESDLVIKMNTGSGKTVVGLIALKSCLNEGIGPAVYITPDVNLAAQVRAEATGLGIDTTDEPDSARFRQGKAILVTNIYKLFNGLSVFGVKGSGRSPINLGAVLVDDAHACVATVEAQYTLRLADDHAAYRPLVDLFAENLATQSTATFQDIEAKDPFAVMEVPFWLLTAKQRTVMKILHPHRDDDTLKFVWPLISDTLPICRMAVSATGIEIAPPCPPVDMLPSFARAQRRIYLTATLADDSILVTHFAASPDSVRIPVTPQSADDLGDRMILTPSQTYPRESDATIRQFIADQAERYNVIVIVPSWARAETWRPIASAIHGAGTLQAGLADLRAGHVGLVVLVNKYDGIDLPGDACRLLVLDGLPEALGLLDRLDTVALDGSEALLVRQVQRIEQGMGRGVRSNDDYCVVLLLGKRLTARLYPPAARALLSPATKAQVELSDEVSSLLDETTFDALPKVVRQCLRRDPNWVAAARDALDGLEYSKTGSVSTTAVARREAFDLAQRQRFAEAADRLQDSINSTDDKLMRGWLKQAAAAYMHHVDAIDAQRLQASALADNRSLIKPKGGTSYVRLSSPGEQAKTASDRIQRGYASPEQFVLEVEGLLEQLIPDPDPTAVPLFERGMKEIGLLLGFGAELPEAENGRGPDVLWQLGGLEYLVIECKSGSEATTVPRRDVAQLSHSMDWFEETYDSSANATPVLIHPTRDLDRAASSRTGTQVITFKRLEQLRATIRTFAEAVARDGGYSDPKIVSAHLSENHLNGPAFIARWGKKPRRANR